MVLATPLELSQVQVFLVSGELIWHPVWYFLESRMFAKPRPGSRMHGPDFGRMRRKTNPECVESHVAS